MGNAISRKKLSEMPLRGKPKCPNCKRPLTFVYEGATGYIGEKCSKCGQECLVNIETLEVTKVLEEAG